MSWFMVDIEASGPCPGLFYMHALGCVKVIEPLEGAPTFYGQMRPLGRSTYIQEALDVCNLTHEATLSFKSPSLVMEEFAAWIKENNTDGRPMFISDNNGFDWQFTNYYFWELLGDNPFGHSSTNLGSLYKGMEKNFFTSFKKHRRTKHSHHPVEDCMGNCEALLHMKNKMGLKIKLA